MIGFGLAALLMAGAVQASTQNERPICMSVSVTDSTGKKVSFVSFAVSGSREQLEAIRSAALSIGALAEPPKEVDGRPTLFVFFTSEISPQKAIALYNDVEKGKYHPGVARGAYQVNAMILPIETRKNCPN